MMTADQTQRVVAAFQIGMATLLMALLVYQWGTSRRSRASFERRCHDDDMAIARVRRKMNLAMRMQGHSFVGEFDGIRDEVVAELMLEPPPTIEPPKQTKAPWET